MYADQTQKRSEQGIALLITVMLLLMVSAIGLTALDRAGDEEFLQKNSTRKAHTLAAAEAGVAMITNRLFQQQSVNQAILDQMSPGVGQPPGAGQGLSDPLAPLDEQTLIQDEYGFWTQVRTGTVDSAVPQPIERKDSMTPEGYTLNAGEQPWVWRIYRATVVATDPGGGNVQIQTQYRVKEDTSYN